MKKVMQTILKPPHGNCLQACLASLLELPLDDVPNFCSPDLGPVEKWSLRMQSWLAEVHGLGWIPVLPSDQGEATYPEGTVIGYPRGLSIKTGKSPRGDFQHSCVARDGEIVHDPYPGGGGVLPPCSYDILYLLDPARVMTERRED